MCSCKTRVSLALRILIRDTRKSKVKLPKMSAARLLILAYLMTLQFVNVARAVVIRFDDPVNCPAEFEGKLPYPPNCMLYVECSGGKATVKQCVYSMAYNPAISDCDWLMNVPDCSDGGFVPEPATTKLG